MFTGLIEEVGEIAKVKSQNDGMIFHIKAKDILVDVKVGDSINVNGACQTVESFGEDFFTIYSIPETLKVTNFSLFKVKELVNLERAMKMGDRLGGHIVQGHVEDTAKVVEVEKHVDHSDYTLQFNSPFILQKGSICLDGISLTVQELIDDRFRVQIIPETVRKTNISSWQVGRRVNIETDYLLHGLERIMHWREKNN